jgi:hypothetical protein
LRISASACSPAIVARILRTSSTISPSRRCGLLYFASLKQLVGPADVLLDGHQRRFQK